MPGDELHLLLKAGLPFDAFERLLGLLGVPAGVLADLVGVAPRTLARRKTERSLSAIESDRLYRVAHVVAAAVGTLGSLDKARLWLQRENRALGGTTPLSLLDTEVGVRRVEEVLARVDHGIAS
jgi:putative toxin-antitoxin system antitoxin component (TIGR02293 family)